MRAAAFLYRSKKAAEQRSDLVGTAFIVGCPAERLNPSWVHMYAVTASHCALDAGDTPTLTLNRRGGGAQSLETDAGAWKHHPDHDVAICYLDLGDPSELDFNSLDYGMLLSEEDFEREDVGVGDDVFLVGRFVLHDESPSNRPILRWGSIAAMANHELPYEIEDVGPQPDAFLAEIRSRPGLSGSLVGLLRWQTTEWRPKDGSEPKIYRALSGIVGVDCAFVPDHGELWREGDVQAEDEKVEGLYTRETSGVSVVVPSWKIIELLEAPKVVAHRRKDEDETLARGEGRTAKVSPASSKGDTRSPRPGPEPGRLQSDETVDELAKRVMDAGKPDDWDEEEGG